MNENLTIDPSQLDEEWLQQPLLFDEAQEESADCLRARDKWKETLVNLEAELALDIRNNFENYELKKAPAQAIVDDLLTTDPRVADVRTELIQANHDLALANNAVRSFEMRKKALEKLTDLHISNYFSVPNPNHMLDGGKRYLEAKKEKAEENSTKATTGLNEKKKARKSRTKKEVLADIKDPGVKEALEKATETEEEKTPRRRRR